MVSAEDAVKIYRRLTDRGITVWLCGGWGVDALLGEQTRPHKDLDMLIWLRVARRLRKILGREGYTLKMLWSENRWVKDAEGVVTATAFVLTEGGGREIDIHALEPDEAGDAIPAWNYDGDFFIPKQELSCQGRIDGQAVGCLSYRLQKLGHAGYALPEPQVDDMERLRRKFEADGGPGAQDDVRMR